jgi:hypothetical protein
MHQEGFYSIAEFSHLRPGPREKLLDAESRGCLLYRRSVLTADMLVQDDDHSGAEMLSQPDIAHSNDTSLKAFVRSG